MRKEREKLLTRLESRESLHAAVRAACKDSVESNPQTEFKPPSEYVRMVMKAHKDKQLTSDEFMLATGLTVFKLITDTFWTALYKRPDLYVYVTEDIINSEDLIKFDNFDFNLLLL